MNTNSEVRSAAKVDVLAVAIAEARRLGGSRSRCVRIAIGEAEALSAALNALIDKCARHYHAVNYPALDGDDDRRITETRSAMFAALAAVQS
jgi:hypothetical protein